MATARTRTTPGDPSNAAIRGRVRSKQLWGVVIAVAAGAGMAAQSRVNGQLGEELHDSVLAAVISFGGGLLVLLGALALSVRMRAGLGRTASALRTGGLRPWHCLGGIAGATYVLGQSVAVAVLGVAMFTVGVVAGQTVSGLFVDKAGLGPGEARALSWPRVLGAGLTVLAVGGALAGDLASAEADRAWLLVLPLVAGTGMAVQQAFNGRVGAVSGSPLTAALVNFTAGTTVLLLGWLVSLAVRGGPTAWPTNPVLYLGGLVGVVVITVASFLVSWIGVLLLGLALVTGQLIGSVLLDLVVPVTGEGVRASTVMGCVLALAAVTVAALGGRNGRRAALEESAP